jgi:hypothetical protein
MISTKRPRAGNHLLIVLPDFERIFRTVHGVLLNEKADLDRACLFFAVIGASILRIHHKLDAVVVCGFAAFKIDENNDVLVLGTQKDGFLASENNAFHCWVQCNDWFLDFASPLFQEMFASCGIQKTCPRRMLQKQQWEMSESLSELRSRGHFLYGGNQDLTKRLVDGFFSRRAYEDILNICLEWYKPTPKKMQEVIGVGDSKGRVMQTRLSPIVLNGAW